MVRPSRCRLSSFAGRSPCLPICAGLVLVACKVGVVPPVPPVPAPPAPVDVVATMDAVVADYRGTIALLAGDSEPGDKATTVAWLLAEANHDRLDTLAARMASDPATQVRFLDKLENDATLHDADKLAFRDQLMELPASARVDQDRAVLAGIEARYDAEMKKLFGRLPTRGLADRREAWDDYLAVLRRQVSTDALLAAHAAELDALVAGSGAAARSPGATTRIRSLACALPTRPCC